MKHLLSIETMATADMAAILKLAKKMKVSRGHHAEHPATLARCGEEGKPLQHQCWAMMFSKSSTRTRVSFEVGIRELGGDPIFLNAQDIQLGRGEPIADTARVIGRMCHGAVIRTFAQKDVEDFAKYSGIPTINALTDDEHPCQILTDIFTFEEKHKSIRGKIVCFIGDGNCNVPRSWLFAAARLGFHLRIASPEKYLPPQAILDRARAIAEKEKSGGTIATTSVLAAAAKGVDLLYTDVWISMGKESESAERLKDLAEYQINAELVALAKKNALVMHCLPAYRGKEITADVFEAHASTIFDQAENRLHVQKAILSLLDQRQG